MKAAILLLASSCLLRGTLITDPTACQNSPGVAANHPCTWTITCDAVNCTTSGSNEVGQFRTAVTNAWLGDTVKLQAGRNFLMNSVNRLIVRAKTQSAGTGILTITSTRDDMLPNPAAGNTRITPHWTQYMPVLQFIGNDMFTLDCTPPASNIRIRGLIFENGSDATSSGGTFLHLGCVTAITDITSQYPYSNYTPPQADADQPDNIVVEHCIFRNRTWLANATSFYMSVNTRDALIRNNWFAGTRYSTSEVQAILVFGGPGPVDIVNNYIADVAGQNIMIGGQGPPYDVPTRGRMIFNSLYNHPERMVGKLGTGRWSAKTEVFKGRMAQEKNPNASVWCYWRANNSGTTAGSNPFPWAAGVAQSVACPAGATRTDNDVTWQQIGTGAGNGSLGMKALLESKSSLDFLYSWNQFRGFTNWQQVQAVIFKMSNYPPANGIHGRCTPYMSGRLNTTVEGGRFFAYSADGKVLPNNHLTDAASYAPNSEPTDLRIGSGAGTIYTIKNFIWDDNYKIELTTSAGTQTNVPWEYGWTMRCSNGHWDSVTQKCIPNGSAGSHGGPCIASWDRNGIFRHNIVEDSSVAITIAQLNQAMQERLGGLRIEDNLIRGISCNEWGGCSAASRITYYIAVGQMMPFYRIERNTFIDSTAGSTQFAGVFGFVDSPYTQIQVTDSPRYFRGNFIVPTSVGAVNSTDPNRPEGTPSLRYHMCGDAPCDKSMYSHNVFAGEALSNYTDGGPVYNLCSGTGSCVPNTAQYNAMFVDWDNRVLQVKPSSQYFNAMDDGSTIGARFDLLPMARKVSDNTEGADVVVNNTAKSVAFKYWLPSPYTMHEIGGSVEISTTRDMDNPISVTDPRIMTDLYGKSAYPHLAERLIQIPGLNNGTYYYRLHVGSIYEGCFKIPAAACP